MSQHDLRDLLHERVADETAVDLASGAWRAGRRSHRRRTVAVLGGVVATSVVVSGVVAVVDSTAPRSDQQPTRPLLSTKVPPTTTAPAPSPQTRPAGDADFQGTPVWFSPDQIEERDLPYLDGGPFPETLDLDVRTKDLVGPARAAFASGGRVLLVGDGDSLVSLDVSGFGQVTDLGGNRFAPVGPGMLSPSGESLLVTEDEALHVYDVSSGEWTLITTGSNNADVVWFDADTLLVPSAQDGLRGRLVSLTGEPVGEGELSPLEPDFDTTYAGSYGRVVTSADGTSSAQAWGGGVSGLPERSGPQDLLGLGFIAVESPAATGVLTLTTVSDETDVRSKGCCAVVGWLDAETVVYETRQLKPGLVAWTVGTDDFRRVTTIEDDFTVASFADLR